MSEANMAKAREVYDTLCRALDNMDWNYEKIEENLVIKSGVKGDDLPIDFIMRVNPKNEIVSFISFMPFKVEEEKRFDVALATCIANYGMVDGSFDFDLADGSLLFRLTSSYRESTLGEELFEYMIMVSANTIDHYNDKFLAISKGLITLEQFIESDE